jgi:hypothetical protein
MTTTNETALSPSTFFTLTVGLIESASIKEWAQSAHNKPIIITAITAKLQRDPKAKPRDFATYLTLCAMG